MRRSSRVNGPAKAALFVLVVLAGVFVASSPASASTIQNGPHVYGILEDLGQWLADQMRLATIWLFEAVMEFLKNAPEPDFSSPQAWITGLYNQSLKIGAWLVIPFVIVSTIQRLLKGGVSEVLKLYLVALPIAIIGAVVGLALITLLQRITDDMCGLLYDRMTQDFNTHMEALKAEDFSGETDSLLIQLVFFLAMLIGVAILFIELIVRNVAIYMSVLFLPMALAAYVWEPTRTWFTRVVEAISVFVICKFVIVAVLSFTFAVMSYMTGVSNDSSVGQNIGLLILTLMALFVSTVASPLLIGFILSPQVDSDSSTFQHVRSTSIIGSNQSFNRTEIGNTVKNLTGRGEG